MINKSNLSSYEVYYFYIKKTFLVFNFCFKFSLVFVTKNKFFQLDFLNNHIILMAVSNTFHDLLE